MDLARPSVPDRSRHQRGRAGAAWELHRGTPTKGLISMGLRRSRHEVVVGRRPSAAPPSGADIRPGVRYWTPIVAGLVTLAVTSWGLAGPSFWLDESATLAIARRSVPDILGTLENVDAVHGSYYVFMHFWLEVAGTSEFAARFPSALAMAVAAGGIAVLGMRISGPRLGLTAGLVFAANPTTSRFAEEARTPAFVTALAVWATVAFCRARCTGRRRAWAGYSILLGLLILTNIFGFFLVAAHAVSIGWDHRMSFTRPLLPLVPALRCWLVSIAVPLLALTPFVLFAATQRVQVNWIPRPEISTFTRLAVLLAGDRNLIFVSVPVVLLGAAVADRSTAIGLLAWMLVPALTLLAVSVVHPVFLPRYVVYSVPAACLLIGLALDWFLSRIAVGWAPVAAIGILLTVLAVPRVVDDHRESSKLDNLRGQAEFLRHHQQPGDGVFYLSSISRWAALAYPSAYTRLDDVTLAAGGTPAAQENLRGLDTTDVTILRRLGALTRVWVIRDRSIRERDPKVRTRVALMRSAGFSRTATYTFKGAGITLWTRADH